MRQLPRAPELPCEHDGAGWLCRGRPVAGIWAEPRRLVPCVMLLALALAVGTANDCPAVALVEGRHAPEQSCGHPPRPARGGRAVDPLSSSGPGLLHPQRPKPSTTDGAMRSAFAEIVSAGLRAAEDGKNEESASHRFSTS